MGKKSKSKSKTIKKEELSTEMQCSPNCIFFPDMTCYDWEYDKDNPEIKRRKDAKKFKCAYDGHIITNWYSPCPQKLEKLLKENNEEK
jgi:hypothetical protein